MPLRNKVCNCYGESDGLKVSEKLPHFFPLLSHATAMN